MTDISDDFFEATGIVLGAEQAKAVREFIASRARSWWAASEEAARHRAGEGRQATTEWDGRPENPERDGWHWLLDHEDGRRYPCSWEAEFNAWVGQDIIDRGTWSYIGPCLTPAEIAQRERAVRVAALEEAALEVDCACAARGDVLNRFSEHGHKRASYLCPVGGDTCCALQAVAIRALAKEAGG